MGIVTPGKYSIAKSFASDRHGAERDFADSTPTFITEDRDGNRLRGVAAELIGNDRGMCFSLLQGRELFADVVGGCDAAEVGLEKISGQC